MTLELMEALISAAGMTAFAADCDRLVLAKRDAPRANDQLQAFDTLDRLALGL